MQTTRWRKILDFEPKVFSENELEVIASVREHIVDMAHIKPESIVKLWKRFSNENYAGWYVCNNETIKEFYQWATEVVYDGEEE